MPTVGERGQPRFSRADPTRTADYWTQVSDYAASTGNRMVGTTTDRNALSFDNQTAWEGLRFRDLTDGNEYEFDSSGNARLILTDSDWQLSPITAATGWTAPFDPVGGTADQGVGGVRLKNGWVSHRWRTKRSGAAITADGSSATNPGNFGDVPLAAVDTDFAPSGTEYGDFFIVGVGQGSVRIDAGGAVTITDMYPSAVLATNATIQVRLSYLRD